jgi:hypothetical protein
MMVQEQSLVPADLRDIGRDVPSRPATILGTRQGATEQQQQQQMSRDARERAQPTKLDLFRSAVTWWPLRPHVCVDVWTTMLWSRRTRSSGRTVDVAA